MSAAAPMLSVVVPTHQRRELLLRLLRSLARQELPPATYEAVVCLDRCTDGTAAAVDALEVPYALRRIESGGRGRAAACNTGVTAAHGDVILILDDDMEPDIACLRRHLDAHRGAPHTCVIGAVPIRIEPTSSFTERYVAQRFAAHLAKLEREGLTTLRDFYSGNASIRRSVLQDVGGFDEAFTVYGNEDLELAFRLRAAGVVLRYVAAAAAHQRYTKSFRGLARDTIQKGRTAVLLAQLHPETFGELQLSRFDAESVRWRFARALLLAPGRRWRGAPELVLRAAAAAERSGLARRRLFYAFMLDYFYWAGVAAALAESRRDERLEALHNEVNHGAIGLLLHR